MEKDNIKCPNCGQNIDINSVLYNKLEQEIKAKYAKEAVAHEKEYESAKEKLKAKELEFAKKQSDYEKNLHVKLQEELLKERTKLEKDIKKQLETEQSLSMAKLKEEIEEKSEKLKELNASKIEIEKLKRSVDEATQQATLKAEQTLNERLNEEKIKISKFIQDENDLKIKQKDEQINQIKRQLEEAKRKTEQGSMQIQGEAGELIVEEWLNLAYPFDEIQEIKKGQRGGDCLQIVNTRDMLGCGKIYYEVKRTKDFQPSWIGKFKADMIEKGVDVGVLVTLAKPKDMENMGIVDGVWVCGFDEFKGLSAVLRENIIKIATTLKSNENKTDKMSLIYSYLTSNEFSMQIESIVSGFAQLQHELDREKRAMAKIWKEREKQIEMVIENTTRMFGSIKGIAGNAIGNVKSLQLPYEDSDL